MEKKKPETKAAQFSIIRDMMDSAIQCGYVKLQTPVAHGDKDEPMYEFKLLAKDAKYKADQISHTSHLVFIRRGDAIVTTPTANMVVARPIQI